MDEPTLKDLLLSALAIADRAVIADIETEGLRIGVPHARCYDVGFLLDSREQPPEAIDMFKEALGYAVCRRLVEIDIAHPHIVRIKQLEHRSLDGPQEVALLDTPEAAGLTD